ncbi:aldo/keto reductase [Loktanella sp. SALINAS62]|uniref:aldo/keto reductase n=1 Tax=Loktanella sp. SALINAS62 TaxID=2706124 RepID=UPI001B8C7B90|nr:aldo/keto reductase [Loktanella sp. SALINAS62]MBS1301477.1 aldo/keto reductase [Loktanella sp. SALINAS62]
MRLKSEKAKIGRDVPVRRLVTGLWQMADQERDGKPYDLDAAAQALVHYARDGFDTFDMADHYGSAEVVAGMAHKALTEAGDPAPTILTKWCPEPGSMDEGTVRRAVETALERLGLPVVDVMQFHWWRYESPNYLTALKHLMRLREEGLIREIGLTNFDAAHLNLVLREGIEVASNQVCFSLLDCRAAGALSDVAEAHDVAIFAFGTLCGGFLSNKWLGVAEPDRIDDWSRMKYKRFIDASGGWARFQELLGVLGQVAHKHGVSISNVATAWTLAHPAITATIIGARLGEGEHRSDNKRALELVLDPEDRAAIEAVVSTMPAIPGDCGDEYRKPPFLTASGDLSHHLATMAPVFPVVESTARPGRTRAESGSIWEEKAGFSRALRSGDRVSVSGTTATGPDGSPVASGDAAAQATFILDKISAAIEALGGSIDDVTRTRIYLRHEADWEAVSAIHALYLKDIRPANTLIAGVNLIGPYDVEIEAEADISGTKSAGGD